MGEADDVGQDRLRAHRADALLVHRSGVGLDDLDPSDPYIQAQHFVTDLVVAAGLDLEQAAADPVDPLVHGADRVDPGGSASVAASPPTLGGERDHLRQLPVRPVGSTGIDRQRGRRRQRRWVRRGGVPLGRDGSVQGLLGGRRLRLSGYVPGPAGEPLRGALCLLSTPQQGLLVQRHRNLDGLLLLLVTPRLLGKIARLRRGLDRLLCPPQREPPLILGRLGCSALIGLGRCGPAGLGLQQAHLGTADHAFGPLDGLLHMSLGDQYFQLLVRQLEEVADAMPGGQVVGGVLVDCRHQDPTRGGQTVHQPTDLGGPAVSGGIPVDHHHDVGAL